MGGVVEIPHKFCWDLICSSKVVHKRLAIFYRKTVLHLLLYKKRKIINYLQIDRQWMYGDRCSMDFINGLKSFLDAVEANKSPKGFMCCPCMICKNNKDYSKRNTLHSHIYRRGFMDNYIFWTKHGERGVVMEDVEEDDDDNNIPYWAEGGAFVDTTMGEAEEDVAEDEPADEISQVLLDAQKDSENAKDSKKFEKMLEDHKKLLYPDCKQGHKKLDSTLELVQWKAVNGVTNKGFKELLTILKNMLPEGNELPSITYEAKVLKHLIRRN